MALYRVHLVQAMTYMVEVEADSVEDAAEKVWEADGHPGRLCHQCGKDFNDDSEPEIGEDSFEPHGKAIYLVEDE